MSAAVFYMRTPFVRHAASETGRISIRRLALFITLTTAGLLVGLQAAPRRNPDGLLVRERSGQLMIAWAPGLLTASGAGRLEIVDGSWKTTIPVYGYLSGVTYSRLTGDVQVRLIAGRSEQVTRFLSHEDPTPAELSKQMQDLAAEARSVRIATESGLWQLAQIQRAADRILSSLR